MAAGRTAARWAGDREGVPVPQTRIEAGLRLGIAARRRRHAELAQERSDVTAHLQWSVEAALTRLEIIADTYLSVNTSAQLALPTLPEARRELQEPVREQLETNLATLAHSPA
jgi:hypothetical protein